MPALPVLTRVLLQCLATYLVTNGWLAPEIGNMLKVDPDVAFLVQCALGALVSAGGWIWYAAAKKMGWST